LGIFEQLSLNTFKFVNKIRAGGMDHSNVNIIFVFFLTLQALFRSQWPNALSFWTD